MAENAANPTHPAANIGMSTLPRPLAHVVPAFLPLLLLQPILGRIVRNIARQRPELFSRIGLHKTKIFLIDPVNMPFAFMLYPNPERPRLKAIRRNTNTKYHARIAGSFLTLFDMVDGRLDGDALFFTRDLIVEGDTEATVCLRNALDDLEGSIADDIAAIFGSPGRVALKTMRRVRKHNNEN